ncbi:hypothetical protein Misp06_02715 [Microbulbifer sp. NBRC 101763]|uniref:hypothetical protein n=1 Tax=Microbulbifer sp. NBRC 101763 TaxID=1113820 RepID=UPI0030A422E3
MSLVHLRLIRTYDAQEEAIYDVQSIDFNKRNQDKVWQSLGELNFDKLNAKYQYIPTKLWSDTCGYPSEFATPENQSANFEGLGSSPWAKVIMGYAEQFLEKKEYPESHPPLFCN